MTRAVSRWLTYPALLAAALVTAAPATAGVVVFDNGPRAGGQYVWAGGDSLQKGMATGFRYGTPAFPGVTADLTTLEFGSGYWGGLPLPSTAAQIIVSFLEGDDLNAASVLEQWTVTVPLIAGNQFFSLSSLGGVTLQVGQFYWMSMTNPAGQTAALLGGGGSTQFTRDWRLTNGTWAVVPNTAPQGFRVTVGETPAATAPGTVPEPGTTALVAAALAGLALQRRRRQRA